ncbi:protein of unknown function [Clostridium beijerinckii]|nr:protein of unknown function [Clostridium beijerinckii]
MIKGVFCFIVKNIFYIIKKCNLVWLRINSERGGNSSFI